MRFPYALLLYSIIMLIHGNLTAKPSDYFLSVHHEEAFYNRPVEISVELLRSGAIKEIMLMYRSFESTDYIPKEMSITGNTASASIPAEDAKPPFIEYYLRIITSSGLEETYPVTDPEFNPGLIPVYASGSVIDAIQILSPQENESLRFEDLVISISLFDLPERFLREETRVFINDYEITEYALIADDILVAVPSNIDGLDLSAGRQDIRIDFIEENIETINSLDWQFSIIGRQVPIEPVTPQFQYRMSMQGESKSESLAGSATQYNRGTVTFNGELPWVLLSSRLHITNEERSNRQPQNRYSVSAEMPWLRLHAGDTYPKFPSLILNGRRVRGFHGQLDLGAFSLDYATGQTIRHVEGSELYQIPADSVDSSGTLIQPPVNSVLINDSTYAIYNFGTHTRTITAIRPSFGRADFVQLGFTYLFAQDDIGSVTIGRRPAENIVLGTDLRILLANRRFEFVGQVAGSMQNTDISRGNLEREELEELVGSEAVDELVKVIPLSTLQKLITINQYLIPFDPRELSSIAVDLHLRMNYYGNQLQFGYIRRGNDYTSFGLTSQRRDVQGFRLRDRLRLFQNQLYFDITFERLRDNLNDTKAHTTYIHRYDASLSYFPRHNFPMITVGYGYLKNDNKVDPGMPGPEASRAIRDITNRYFVQLSHDFHWKIPHNGSLSMNISQRDDRTGRNADIDVYNITGIVNSRLDDVPLRMNIGFGLYHSKIPFYDEPTELFVRSDLNYYNIILGGEYRLMNDNLIVNASFVPTFGDYDRTVFQAGAQYYFMRNLSLLFSVDYLMNPSTRDDIVSSLVLRYNI